MLLRIITVLILATAVAGAAPADQPAVSVPVLYPKDNSIVGDKVNVVLDPTTDWSSIPFFQVVAGNTEYPVVDTSTSRHAVQGVALKPGLNTITVKLLAFADEAKKKGLKLISSRDVKVFSMVEIFTTRFAPPEFTRKPFHSRENEANCSGCHALEATPESFAAKKPEDVICYTCHRRIPTGRYIHGPAAVWSCLSCHNPELYPFKYQFSEIDPWKVTKTTQSVMPMGFTLPSSDVFRPESSLFVSKDKAKELLRDVVEYVKQNPADKLRLEVHTDNVPPRMRMVKIKGKKRMIGYKTNLALTRSRAWALKALLRGMGIESKKVLAVGMGDKLPKAPNKTKEGRELNNRVEIVAYPSDVRIKNSMSLPVLKDRERVVVGINYAQGPPVREVRIVEKVPKGIQYIKGSGFFKGRARAPKIKGDELVWDLGDLDANFSESLFYVVKKGKKSPPVPDGTTVAYVNGGHESVREFNPRLPEKRSQTVLEACMKCHMDILSAQYQHGPAAAGYCTLCHDPHASPYPAWLRKPSWDLCVTCHAEKATGAHVVAAFATGAAHPTKKWRDPARPGKRMACISCHDPHSAPSRYLFAYGAKSRMELCTICHGSKMR